MDHEILQILPGDLFFGLTHMNPDHTERENLSLQPGSCEFSLIDRKDPPGS